MRWFDGAVVSGFEGVAKPDAAIFELLLARFDLDRETTVLIDDSPANVRAARSVGMQAIEFESPERLRLWLATPACSTAPVVRVPSPPAPSSSSADPCRSRGRRSAASDPA